MRCEGVGLRRPWAVGRARAPLPPSAPLQCTVLLHIQMPSASRPSTRDRPSCLLGAALPSSLCGSSRLCLLLPALPPASWATSPSLKTFPCTVEWLIGFLSRPKQAGLYLLFCAQTGQGPSRGSISSLDFGWANAQTGARQVFLLFKFLLK